jgi:CO/xanthine dehydrogenase Mo-binding subunit
VAADEATVITPARALLDAPRFSQQPQARIVGSVQTPVHLDSVLTGAEQYSCDVRLPEMRFGAVARPPYLEATLEGCDRDGAVVVEGVLAVVDGPNGAVGVVAETPMAARRGVSALACRWAALDAETRAHIGTPNDIDAAIAADLLDHTPVDEGSLDDGRALAVRTLDVRYDSPMTAHAAMEPRAGVAHVTESGAVVHTGSQDPWYVQGAVAQATGLSRDAVEVHNHRVGGAFGGRLLCQASVEAAWLSQAVGQPVKVQWTREEEFRFNYVGPEFSHRIETGLSGDGEIAFWHHRMVGSPILTTSALVPPHLRWAADLPADPGTWRGTDMPYRSTNRRVDFADVRGGMPTGAWRGLGAAPNTFAVECVMDELAGLAEADPIEFRRGLAQNPRLARVLERAGVMADWPGRGGLGVAAAAYKSVTFVAVVARVRREHGRPVVDKLWCAHDCGLVIAPDQVRAQIQGNLVWGVGMALFESFELEDGIARTANFDSYRLPRQADVPDMQIELVGGDAAPTGAGEAAFAPAAAAIVNALASLDGVRTRSLPVLAQRAGV